MKKPENIKYIIEDNGCYRCISHKLNNNNGYYIVSYKGIVTGLHRHIYILNKGLIKINNVVRHTCDNRWCINPEHLIQGTQLDNVKDRDNRNRTSKGENRPNVKLTKEQALEIFNNTTNTIKELALKYKVKACTITNIKAGREWKHIHKQNN